MSLISLQGDPNGTGTVTIAAPNTNTSRTISLPDASTTMVGTDTTQTLTNKTLGSGLVAAASLITSDTAKTATGTSVDFTGIPSWVKRIVITMNGISSSGTSNHLVQIGTSGGIEATGYVSGNSNQNGTVSTHTTGFGNGSAAAANAFNVTGVLTLHTGNTWIADFSWNATTGGFFMVGGSKTLSGTLDRIRITTVNGTDTFDAGSINILYE